jgi:diketogulonate reductase-like aldo/keto reductase
MKYRTLYNGTQIPVLGLGTWRLGGTMVPDTSQDERIVQILQKAIRMGYSHIDTAEMYGGGHTEELVGFAIRDFDRSQLQICTKVWQSNLRYHDVFTAFQASLDRLGTHYIDVYSIHLPSAHIPLADTLRALNELVESGQVRHLGVSNFTVDQLKQAMQFARTPIVISQAPVSPYNRKFLKGGLLRHCQECGQIMAAYSPFERGEVLENPLIEQMALRYQATPAQVVLNWIIRQPWTMVYLMSLDEGHLRENLGALGLELDPEDVRTLDELEMPEEKLWPQ